MTATSILDKVRLLRNATGASTKDCLEAAKKFSDDEIEEAKTWLNWKTKQSAVYTGEEKVFELSICNNQYFIVLNIGCKTDFASASKEFKNTQKQIINRTSAYLTEDKNFFEDKSNLEVRALFDEEIRLLSKQIKEGVQINNLSIISRYEDTCRNFVYLHHDKKNGYVISYSYNDKSLDEVVKEKTILGNTISISKAESIINDIAINAILFKRNKVAEYCVEWDKLKNEIDLVGENNQTLDRIVTMNNIKVLSMKHLNLFSEF